MWLYFSKEFTATQVGSTIRDVNCEKCGCAYHYELARTGVGAASSAYMLNNAGAASRAQRRAVENLRHLLLTEIEAVPCPGCGWVQADMARWLQRDYLRWVSQWAWGLGAVAVLVLFVWWLALYLDDGWEAKPMREVYGWAIVIAAIVGALIGLRRMLASMQDPNRGFPARPRVRPGTPPALVRMQSDDAQTPERYVPAREEELTVTVGQWAEVQIQRAVLPDACCLCLLGGPDCLFSVPYCLSTQPMQVPLCRACRRATFWRWWAWALVSLLLAAGVGGVAGWFTFGTDDVGRVMVGVIAFIIAAAVLPAVVPLWRVRPYHIRTIDADRGVVRIWFSNPRYTELFVQQYLQRSTLETGPLPPPPPKATRVKV